VWGQPPSAVLRAQLDQLRKRKLPWADAVYNPPPASSNQREADPSLMPPFDPDTISEAAIDRINRFNYSF
jgi:hypothetical protein